MFPTSNGMKKDLTALVVLIAVLAFVAYLLGVWTSSSPVPIKTTTTSGNPIPEVTPNIPTEPSELTMIAKINKPATGIGVTLAPIEVVEDSRCPTDENIQCIQAGTVRVRTKVTNMNGERILVFTIGTPIASKTETIELLEVLPDARAEVPIVINEYRFIFKITKRVI